MSLLKRYCCWLWFVLLFSTSLYAKQTVVVQSPVATVINGLTVTATPGSIILANTSGKDIPVSKLLLTFDLNQASVSSLWGSPWLSWQADTSSLIEPKSYRFVSQGKLTNNTFYAGAVITINYNPLPWNSSAQAKNVQLYNMSYPIGPVPIQSSVTSNGSVINVTITNASDQAVNLDGAQVLMTYAGKIQSSIWGTPWANWQIKAEGPNYIFASSVAVDIPSKGNLTLSFNGQAGAISNIELWAKGGSLPTQHGVINLTLPTAPSGVNSKPEITITGPSFPYGKMVDAEWGKLLTQNNLQLGSYTFSAPAISAGNKIYSATFTPNPVSITNDTPQAVKLAYNEKQFAKLVIQMPATPESGLAAPQLTINGPEFPASASIKAPWGENVTICRDGKSTCSGIEPGDYAISAPTLYSSANAYIAKGFVNPVQVKVGDSVVVPLAYQVVPQGPFTLTVNASGASNTTFAMQFKNQMGNVFTKNLVAGSNSISLPSYDTYVITPPTIAGYSASVTPATLTVSEKGTAAVSVKYEKSATVDQQFVVYYGGWNGIAFDLSTMLPSNVTSVILSFANITPSLQVDTSVSGRLTDIPKPSVQMWPSYINWTVFKFNHPKTKVLLAVGGATFSAIWNNVLTAANADEMAKNIAAVVNRTYPVYKGNISYPQDLLGNVTLDGVDLDVETGSRLSENVTNNVVLLTQSLKKYLSPGKVITAATFSVGADPNNSQCTVPGSIHCGENILLLQKAGEYFDWVNLMAYDAGQEYAASLYRVALTNYAKYIPKSKVLLGLDVQPQWPGFTETAEALAAKAAWQKQNNGPGIMFWGVGVMNNPPLEVQYINTIAASIR